MVVENHLLPSTRLALYLRNHFFLLEVVDGGVGDVEVEVGDVKVVPGKNKRNIQYGADC